MKLALSCIALVAVALAGCGGGDESAAVLYKPTGTLQCSPTQTTRARLDAEVSALRAAGVPVIASSCAHDGVARVALCGAETGDLFAVTVASSSEARAMGLGYHRASQYPDARPLACP